MSIHVSTTWAALKTKASADTLTKYYIDRDEDYIVIIGSSTMHMYTKLTGANITDFEDNHKSAAVEVNSFGEAVGKFI